MGGCVGGWVGQLVNGWVNGFGSGEITNYLVNLDIIEIIQFCLKIYDLLETPPPMGGWVDGCVQWVKG